VASLSKKKHSAPLTVSRPELLVDGRDDAFRQLVHDCLAFSSRLLAIRDGYAAIIGLSGPQYTLLVSVAHLQDHGDVGVKSLAEHLNLSGTFVTTETNKLVQQGLLTKVKDQDDGRRVSLRVTAAARQKLSELSLVQQQVNNLHFGGIDAEQFLALRQIMPSLIASSDRGLSLLGHLSLLGTTKAS
jgi:MarR family transcriptional regulator, organic hydroperoxide resistance regulator